MAIMGMDEMLIGAQTAYYLYHKRSALSIEPNDDLYVIFHIYVACNLREHVD